MGIIEISDGVSCRRMQATDLDGRIRIDLDGDDGPEVIVPTGVRVEWLQSAR